MSFRPLGIDADGLPESRNGSRIVIGLHQDEPHVVMCRGELRTQTNCFAKFRDDLALVGTIATEHRHTAAARRGEAYVEQDLATAV